MNNEIKPIETVYKGHKFRSRLEARWAVFFDAAGIKYEYETEGYELENGLRYLPDFYLPEVKDRHGNPGIYVEVKGVITEADLKKIDKFTAGFFDDPDKKRVLIVGGIPYFGDKADSGDMDRIISGIHWIRPYWGNDFIDGDGWHCFFGKCNNGDVMLMEVNNAYDAKMNDWDPTYFLSCYKKACMARFEHGECG